MSGSQPKQPKQPKPSADTSSCRIAARSHGSTGLQITAERPRRRLTQILNAPGRQPSLPKMRSLLVLDGARLRPESLRAAEARCLQLADRVDILLVNAPGAPTSMLHKLLIELEQAGIDYRLTSASGNLIDQLANYLKRFVGIKVVIVDALPTLAHAGGARLTELFGQSYRLVSLEGAA